MNFDHDAVKESFRELWKAEKDSIKFLLNGEMVNPEKISNFSIQIKEGNFGEGYNFLCTMLNLRLQIGNCEKPYKGEFYLKVIPVLENNDIKPTEKAVSIKQNTIILKAYA